MTSVRFALAVVLCSACLNAQPLTNPYDFSIPDSVDLDTALVVGPIDSAGSHGRVISLNGHLAFEDSTRFRPVGTTLQLGAIFPDSLQAIRLAKRLRALGITCVRLAYFDYTYSRNISILANGNSTLENGLDPEQMARFDWFMHQLRSNGIYYVFTFHGVWNPRPGDGVNDSTGFGARVPLFFESNVQQIHRGIIRLLLEHVNPHTGLAYKEDPALAFIIAGEDASVMVYWMYTKDIIRLNNYGASFNLGLQHHAYIDSLFYARLRGKGLNTDAKLNAAWKTTPDDPAEKIRNGGFEDPFNPSWTLGVNSGDGAQALMQYSETEKREGNQSGKILIGSLDRNRNSQGIYLYQTLSNLKRLRRYTLSLWMKADNATPTHRVVFLIHAPSYPFNSYGFSRVDTISNQWAQYTYTFVSSATDEISAIIQIQFGLDPGSVFIDAVSLKEIGFDGLRPGESISNNSLTRSDIWDASVSPKRIKEEFNFYMDQFTSMLKGVYSLVRDTLQSKVLLCPSMRTYTDVELHSIADYDLFVSTDWRTSATSMLLEPGGGTVYNHTQYDLADKPFILATGGIVYPRPYQSEMTVVMPAYAGLQDWDGVFFSVFTSTPRTGNVRVDSGSSWEIFDKPFVLTMLPSVSNALRSFDVLPSQKVVQITNSTETLSYPPLHIVYAYSLSMPTDSRMPLFRRVEMMPDLAAQESFLPHREISALSGNVVDPTTLDAENGQIFLNAAIGVLRVITPRYIAIAGILEGQIINEPGIIVEQTSAGRYTSVVFSSLTDNPIAESERNLLVIGARGLNRGTVFAPDSLDLESWGSGPMQLEARTVRITITAPAFDSCFVVPLGNDARHKGIRRNVPRSPTGRFSIEIDTRSDETPWYKILFTRLGTGVAETEASAVEISPNPAADYVHVKSEALRSVKILDLYGTAVLAKQVDYLNDITIPTDRLPSGSYTVEVTTNTGRILKPLIVVR
ncbi:MAG: carbohydrate binding domain-containing protein [Ignavibacteria bacterium]|nr:carbohydrate binding domain-containing protein [Ignavibacteria bacterium]